MTSKWSVYSLSIYIASNPSIALRLRNEPEWKNFLTNAGIPDSHSTLYAKTFVANQLKEKTVLRLTTEHLEEMDIKVLGNQLAIPQHIATLAAPAGDRISQNSAVLQPPPSTIKMRSIVFHTSHPQSCRFVVDWNVYTQMTSLPSSQIGPHLYNACNDTVQHSGIKPHPVYTL